MPVKPTNYPDNKFTSSEALERLINPQKLPQHIAIIMDGNGRWAKQHGFRSRVAGHRAGVKAVRETVTAAAELGIKVLSLYAFSKENWLRPRREVMALMRLLSSYIDKELPTLQKNKIKLVVSGDLEDLPDFVRKKILQTIKATADNQRMTLNLCLSYGGRDEIIYAVRQLAQQVQNGLIRPAQIDKELFSQYLYHPELGDPDLLIRTSGELRISNFLLWEIAYTEICVLPVLWPDFRREHLVQAILDYQRRERRFGRVPED